MRFIRGKEYTLYLVKAVIALIFVGVIFLFAVKVKAADDHLVINEIYPASLSGEKEWVELYNPAPYDIDLNNYSLKDGAVAAKNLTGMISAGGYFVFEASSGWLNNGGETLSLIYKPDNTTTDIIIYGDWNDNQDNQPPAPGSGRSLSRIPNGFDSDNDKFDFRIATISKGEENVLPVYSNSVIINEIVPQPATGPADEFIELYNSSSADIDLSDWQIDDIADGGSSPFTIPDGTVILAGGYIIFYNSTDHISLNDSGDFARLVDPNGDEKTSANYTSSKRGQSYSKFFDNWQWTTTLTPLAQNILVVEVVVPDQDMPILQTDITGARNQLDGETVCVSGIVSVPPGRLSSQYFYIQDGNAGIQIYNYNKIFPALNAGDEVKITGEMATISGERRIKISELSDIVILSSHPPPEAEPIEIDQINKSFEGEYVRIVGTVVKTSGSTFYLHGRGPEGAPLGGEIQVSIRAGTGIKKPKMKVGDVVEVAGILSQYGDTYRLLPIVQSDVKIVKSSGLPKSGPGLDYTIIISIILSWITLAILRRKQRL